MKIDNIIVALPTEDQLLGPLYHWGQRFDWTSISSVHFAHIVKKTITPLEFGLVEMPDEKTYKEMIPTLERFLRDEAQKIIPPVYKGELFFHLEIDFHPEDYFINLIKKVNASLAVVSTRGKHGFEGLFHSSFTEHLIKFSPCDVYVVRPEK
ncbi:MAG: universal stress protein [Bacteriovoracaceae bacterium]